MDNIQRSAEDNRGNDTRNKTAFIAFSICALILSFTCIFMYITDEVIPGEGQDPRTEWIFITSMGVFLCSMLSVAFLYEHLSNNKYQKELPIFITSVIFTTLTLTCGLMSLGTMSKYGPGLDKQTYTVEEADFRITFPKGLSLIEETSDEKDYHRLYAFSKAKTIFVHIRTSWKPEERDNSDFTDYVSEEFSRMMRKEVFDRTRTISFDGFDAIRIVGRSNHDNFNEFRAIYDILHGSTYVRIVIYKDNLSGKPDESFIKECNSIVSTIRFSKADSRTCGVS